MLERISFFSANTDQQHNLQKAISTADVAYVIDWTGSFAYQSILDNVDKSQLKKMEKQQQQPLPPSLFVVYMNFRVFSLGMTDQVPRKEWFDSMEIKAIQHANVIVALSQKDAEYLSFLQRSQRQQQQKQPLPIEVVLPPLRQDIEDLARNSTTSELIDNLPTSIRSVVEKRKNIIIIIIKTINCLCGTTITRKMYYEICYIC